MLDFLVLHNSEVIAHSFCKCKQSISHLLIHVFHKNLSAYIVPPRDMKHMLQKMKVHVLMKLILAFFSYLHHEVVMNILNIVHLKISNSKALGDYMLYTLQLLPDIWRKPDM